MTSDKVQQIGLGIEATEGSDPIDAVDAKYWLHGIHTRDQKNYHPTEDHLWNPIYHGDSLMPNEQEHISTTLSEKMISYLPVNLLPFYHTLGKATSPATPIIIEAMTPGSSLPSSTYRTESTGGTQDKIFSGVGCKIVRLDGIYTRLRAIPSLSFMVIYSGIRNVTPSYNDIHNGPEYPTVEGTVGGTQVAYQRFKRDTNTAMIWDQGGDNDNILNPTTTLKFSIINMAWLDMIQGQKYPRSVNEGNFRVELGLQILRGNNRSIYDDFKAATQHDFRFKIYAGPTNYMQLDFDSIALASAKANVKVGVDSWLWDFFGTANGVQIEGVDGINQSEYYDI